MIKRTRAEKIVGAFPKANLLVIGDLMMDRFIWGAVSRISPEAPVPVVEVKSEEDRPGGAGNVIFNLVSLESRVFAGGIVGMDPAGERLVRDFESRGVNVEGILLDPARPTSLKTRVVANHQHVVRFDRESKLPLSQDFETRLLDHLQGLMSRVDAVIISDYGKGLVTRRLVESLTKQCRRLGLGLFVDPKPENMRLYRRVTCVTPNVSEAFLGMGRLPQEGDEEIEAIGGFMLKTLGLREAIITRGARGMTLFSRDPRSSGKTKATHIPTMAKEVFDVTGAGDTVVASYALGQVAGASAFEAAVLANAAAGVVVSKVGTATVTRAELLEAIEKSRRSKFSHQRLENTSFIRELNADG